MAPSMPIVVPWMSGKQKQSYVSPRNADAACGVRRPVPAVAKWSRRSALMPRLEPSRMASRVCCPRHYFTALLNSVSLPPPAVGHKLQHKNDEDM